MWSVKCGVGSVECVKCRVWSVKCGVWFEERGVRSVKCMRSVKWKV